MPAGLKFLQPSHDQFSSVRHAPTLERGYKLLAAELRRGVCQILDAELVAKISRPQILCDQ
jgi:hypothetical protein